MDKLNLPFEMKQIEEDANYFIFEGYASTFGNVDLGDDRVLAGAYKKTIADLKSKALQVIGTEHKALMPALFQHYSSEPVGSFIDMEEDARGLFVKGILPKADTFVSGRLVPQLRVRAIKQLSIGYQADAWTINEGVRDLEVISLRETSFVTFPMNEEAEITGLKNVTPFNDLPVAPRTAKWSATEATERVRKWAGAEDAPNEKYKEAFLLCEEKSSGDFNSYKLPFADIIDGKLTAIPQALFSAAALAPGDQAARKHIEKYYKKLDLVSPFEDRSSFRIDDLKTLSVRDLEKLLIKGVHTNKKTATQLATHLKDLLGRDAGVKDSRDAVNWGEVMGALTKIKP